MNRFASTRSEKRASQPLPGRAQCSVGSIDDDGIRYGLITHALIASTIAIAPTIVTIQSIVIRQPRGRPRVARVTGFQRVRVLLLGRRRRSGSQVAGGARRPARARDVVAATAVRVGEHLVRLAQLAHPRVPLVGLDVVEPQPPVVRVADLVLGRRRGQPEDVVEIPHPALRTRLCSSRHSSIRPWSPERSTSGTRQPRNSAGRV